MEEKDTLPWEKCEWLIKGKTDICQLFTISPPESGTKCLKFRCSFLEQKETIRKLRVVK